MVNFPLARLSTQHEPGQLGIFVQGAVPRRLVRELVHPTVVRGIWAQEAKWIDFLDFLDFTAAAAFQTASAICSWTESEQTVQI